MPKYNRGYETKDKIVNAAKQLFYEKGLFATKIVEICKLADTNPGNFKYYFESKYDIVNEISGSLLMKTYNFIHMNTEERVPLNSVQKNVMSSMMFYPIILGDEKNVLYYHEVLKQKSIYSIMSKNVRRIYQRFLIDLHLEISEDELKYLSAADLGIRRELTLEYIENHYDISARELVIKIYTLMGRLFKIDEKMMEQYIEEAIVFANTHDFSHIKFLV